MSETPHVTSAEPLRPAATPEEIDASCRWPVMFLASKSGAWLLLASVFGLLTSVKMHGPGLLSGHAWLTYGRIYPAATTMFVYGFALQAGLAVGLWMLCRLCRTALTGAGVVIAGITFWNLGVLWGVLHILAGNSTGFEGVELARGSLEILMMAWIVISTPAMLTFSRRAEPRLYPSVWFVLCALFVFPWIAAAACLLLQIAPVRGTMQALVAWWFVANLHWLVLGFLSLAAIFYFVPKLSGRSLYSHYSALFTFWLVLLFAPWVGVASGAPVPAWVPSLSAVMSFFLLLPAITTLTNIRQTLARGVSMKPGGDRTALRFMVVASVSFAVALLMLVLQSIHPFSDILRLTLFTTAQKQLALFGFVGSALIGGLYVVLPRTSGCELLPRPASLSFALLAVSVIVWTVTLALAGLQQGRILADGQVPFMDSVTRSMVWFRVSTMADLLMVVVSITFCWNVSRPVWRSLRSVCEAALAERAAEPTIKEGARA